MSMDIHFHTCNLGTRAMKKNRFTGKMQSVSVADTLTIAERNAVLNLLRGVGTAAPDKFGGYVVNLSDGGSAEVRPCEEGETQLWVDLLVDLRVLTPGLAQLLWELCRDGNMAAVPVMKNKDNVVLVSSEKQRERALARWSAPLVVDSPDQLFRLLNCESVTQHSDQDQSLSRLRSNVSQTDRLTAEGALILDLRTDAAEIREYIVGRIKSFDPQANDGPGKPAPIKMAYAGYEFDQAGWFAFIFDTRPDAAHDGEWTSHIENNCIERPHWVALRELNESSPISIRGTDGTVRELPAASQFGPLLGEMIQRVMLQVRDDGAFAHLPMSSNWELGLEEFNGSYGWSSLP